MIGDKLLENINLTKTDTNLNNNLGCPAMTGQGIENTSGQVRLGQFRLDSSSEKFEHE